MRPPRALLADPLAGVAGCPQERQPPGDSGLPGVGPGRIAFMSSDGNRVSCARRLAAVGSPTPGAEDTACMGAATAVLPPRPPPLTPVSAGSCPAALAAFAAVAASGRRSNRAGQASPVRSILIQHHKRRGVALHGAL